MSDNLQQETQKQYDVKFFYAPTSAAVNKKADKWEASMKTKSAFWQFDVIYHEPIVFQFGPEGRWTYYCVAILYRMTYKT